MTVALSIKKPGGVVLMVSSWAAWRMFAHLHMRRECTACSGQGFQEWFIEGGKSHPDRWFAEQCRSCRGKGWQLP